MRKVFVAAVVTIFSVGCRAGRRHLVRGREDEPAGSV